MNKEKKKKKKKGGVLFFNFEKFLEVERKREISLANIMYFTLKCIYNFFIKQPHLKYVSYKKPAPKQHWLYHLKIKCYCIFFAIFFRYFFFNKILTRIIIIYRTFFINRSNAYMSEIIP